MGLQPGEDFLGLSCKCNSRQLVRGGVPQLSLSLLFPYRGLSWELQLWPRGVA